MRILGLLLLFGGGATVVFALIKYSGQAAFLSRAKMVEGMVVGYASERFKTRGGFGATSDMVVQESRSFAVIEFVTEAGEPVRFTSQLGSSLVSSARVNVYYDPDEPTRAEMRHGFAQYGWIVLMGVLGAAFALVGVGVFFA
ncbi:MAG: DUF3592 domain-containing protein [Spirochaetaceae bacterium]|nr:MAG: DUF3592 domain-containing protein [Spirochaetaceae bacterium]